MVSKRNRNAHVTCEEASKHKGKRLGIGLEGNTDV